MDMEQERLIAVLEKGVDDGLLVGVTFDDVRAFEFTVKLTGKKYKITWWVNICYLTTECGLYMPFNSVEISGTWPNHFKNNLQFTYHKDKCAIVPIEEYPAKKDQSNEK